MTKRCARLRTTLGLLAALAAVYSNAPAQQVRDDVAKVTAGSGPVTIQVLANDDPGSAGSRLSIIATSLPAHGTLTVAPGGLAVVYTPVAGYVGPDSFTYTATNTFRTVDVLPRVELDELGGVPIVGGFGSALAPVPGTADEYYLLTDRGPNVDGPKASKNVKVFPLPKFTPQIGRYKLADGTLTAVGAPILLENAEGRARNGLPNPVGAGGTGEKALARDGQELGTDPDGIDSEGLVALADGTFWVSDEYGPYLIHFAADGKTLEQLSPFAANAQGRKLPRVLRSRIPNKGMEGLTLTPDGKRVVGILQSPLANSISEEDAAASLPLRIVTLDLVTDSTHTSGATHQYLYLLDDPKSACSEITAVSDSEFLVDERDGKYLGDAASPSAQKKLYRISLTGATDVSDLDDTPAGWLVCTQTIEAATSKLPLREAVAALKAGHIAPVVKELAVDLRARFEALGVLATLYPHDKLEGLAVIDGGRRLVISNDSDFGIKAGDAPPGIVAKLVPTLPGTPQEFTQLLIVDLRNLETPAVTATVTVAVAR